MPPPRTSLHAAGAPAEVSPVGDTPAAVPDPAALQARITELENQNSKVGTLLRRLAGHILTPGEPGDGGRAQRAAMRKAGGDLLDELFPDEPPAGKKRSAARSTARSTTTAAGGSAAVAFFRRPITHTDPRSCL